MKSTFKRIVSALLTFSLLVCSLSSCALFEEYEDDVHEDDVHVHEFLPEANTKDHYKKCACGKIVESESHSLAWVTDLEPTTEAPGYKHIECAICGFTSMENTEIEKLPNESNTIPTVKRKYEQFGTEGDMLEFFDNNSFRSTESILYFNTVYGADDPYYIRILSGYPSRFYFIYDKRTDGKYVNAETYFYYMLMFKESANDPYAPYKTMYFSMVSYDYDGEIDDYEIVYTDMDEHLESYYSALIYQDGVLIGEINYNLLYCGVHFEWIREYIETNLRIYKFSGEK